jgi:hypothetical protein
MRFIRRHLGVWALAWLSYQGATVLALMPLECCLAHKSLEDTRRECTKATSSSPESCPMHAATGHACPMHRDAGSEDAADECAIRGTCTGPALAIMFSIPGVLVDDTRITFNAPAGTPTPQADRLPAAPFSIDTPPPRS